MKSAPPVQEKDVRVEEPPASNTRVAMLVRAVPYLLAALAVSVPLVFAWGSFLVYYDKARDAFGDGRVFDGLVNVVLVALLVVFVACVALTFVLVGKSLGAAVWRWTEGRPALRAGLSSARFGLTSVAGIAAIVALFTWLPGNEATSESRTLKESLEEAGSQVATLLAPDGDTAHATEEPEAPAEYEDIIPPEPEEPPAEPVIVPQRGEDRANAPAPNRPEPAKPSNERNDSANAPVTAPKDEAIDEPAATFDVEEPVADEEFILPEEIVPAPVEPVLDPELSILPALDIVPEPPPEIQEDVPPENLPPESTSPEMPKGPPPPPKG